MIVVNDPNTEYLDKWPTLNASHLQWMNFEKSDYEELENLGGDLKKFLGEKPFKLYRIRWFEARKMKKQLKHNPAYQEAMVKSNDLIWLRMAASYSPSEEELNSFNEYELKRSQTLSVYKGFQIRTPRASVDRVQS